MQQMYCMVHLTLKPRSEVKQNKVTNDVDVAGSLKLPAIFSVSGTERKDENKPQKVAE